MTSAVSLYSGIGGIDLAFKQAGFDVIWANEIDKFACVTYRNNIPCYISEANIKSIDEKTIPKADVLSRTQPNFYSSFFGFGYDE